MARPLLDARPRLYYLKTDGLCRLRYVATRKPSVATHLIHSYIAKVSGRILYPDSGAEITAAGNRKMSSHTLTAGP